MSTDMIGSSVKQYHLVEKIGEGGGGSIFKAEDTLLNRIVAIKLLPPDLLADETARKRFLREAQLASRLDHPNICTIYSIEEDEGYYFIAMQYVEGETLKQVIGGRPLTFDTFSSIALQLADALAYAHSKGVMHRDIKSTNIMLTGRGQVKILDFGLAKLTEMTTSAEITELTQQGSHLGTPAYMSPEQARCDKVDARSDIFSLGVVLYEMAAGQRPFSGRNSVDVMHAVMHDAPRPVAELNRRAPASLQKILARMLAKNPSDRYPSMTAVLTDLQALGRELKSAAHVPDGTAVPYAPVKHVKTGWWSGTVGKLFGRSRSIERTISQRDRSTAPDPSSQNRNLEKKTIAILPFKNLSADPTTNFYGFSLADSIITELAALRSLVVRPSSYVAKYQNQEFDPRHVGLELNVDAILIGSFLKSDTRFRVTPQLIDIRSGELIWSDKIDVEYKDIITIQDEIAQRVVAGLRLKISDDEQARLARAATNNAEAYENYLRGRDLYFNFLLHTANKEDIDAAIAAFKRAVELDTQFALAFSALGTCYTRLVLTGLGSVEDYSQAADAYHRALAINNSLIEPQLYLIYGQLLQGEKVKARATLKQLLAQAPNDPKVHNVAADLARWDGQYDKALREYNRWLRLSPREAVKVYTGRARIYGYKRRFGDAKVELEKAMALEPDHLFVRSFYAFILYYLKDCENATRILTQVTEENPQMQFPKIFLAFCYAESGDPSRARSLITPEVLHSAEADGDVAYWLAGLNSILGQPDEAMTWLQRAVNMGNENYPWFSNDPSLDNLREDARFQDLMASLKVRWERLVGAQTGEFRPGSDTGSLSLGPGVGERGSGGDGGVM